MKNDFFHPRDPEDEIEQIENKAADKQSCMQHMLLVEQDNNKVNQQIQDIIESVMINKTLITALVDTTPRVEQSAKYMISQMNDETNLISSRIKRIMNERDAILAQILIAQQILLDFKDKEDEIAEIYNVEIDEMKENLERKEYLLQYHETKYREAERLLRRKSATDTEIRAVLDNVQQKFNPKGMLTEITEQNVALRKEEYLQDNETQFLKDQINQLIDADPLRLSEYKNKIELVQQYQKPQVEWLVKKQTNDVTQKEDKLELFKQKIKKYQLMHDELRKDNMVCKTHQDKEKTLNVQLNKAIDKSNDRLRVLLETYEGGIKNEEDKHLLKVKENKQQKEEELFGGDFWKDQGNMSSIMINPDALDDLNIDLNDDDDGEINF